MFIRESKHKEEIECKNAQIKQLKEELRQEVLARTQHMCEIQALKDKLNHNKQLLDNCFTYDDLQEILTLRLDWYEKRIDRCKGHYTDAYIENLFTARDELEDVFEVIMDKYKEKTKEDNDG